MGGVLNFFSLYDIMAIMFVLDYYYCTTGNASHDIYLE